MINSVCLVGNLVADPEIKATPTGIKIAKMRVAVNQYWNTQAGERSNRTHYFSLTAWDRKADFCDRFLRKGMKIAVQGSLEYHEWRTQDGSRRSRVEVRVRDIDIMTPKNQGPSMNEPTRYEERTDTVDPDFEFDGGNGKHREMDDSIDNADKTYDPERAFSDDDPVEDDDIPF